MAGRTAILAAALMLACSPGVWAAAGQVDQLRNAASAGDPDAAFQLGRAYKLGNDLPADTRQAEHWFEKAALAGHPKAGAELGMMMLQNGKGADALPWLKKAAEGGDARAQYALATLLYGGQGVPIDVTQGREWMRRAAKTGLPAAVEALAIMEKTPVPADVRPAPYQIVTVKPAAVRPPPSVVPSAPPKMRVAVADPWHVQLGAFSQPANAQRFWQEMKAGVAPDIRPTFPKDGALTRLRLGPFAGREAAARFCASQKQRGRACFEVRDAS